MRLAAAAALGGVIGIERELREREAGFRTHMLVSVGAALFTLVSAYAWDGLRVLPGERRHVRPDPHRGADRHRHRLHRRRRDHPSGPHGPRADDGGDALDGGRDRHGLRGRLLLGGGDRHGDRARRPRAAARRVAPDRRQAAPPRAGGGARGGGLCGTGAGGARTARGQRLVVLDRRSGGDGAPDGLRHRAPARAEASEEVVLRLGELEEVSGVKWTR